MSEADGIVYSDVKFTRPKRNTSGTASSEAEPTYSEVRILKTQSSTELPGSQQHPVSNGGSKVTPERVVIVVLSALLVAAVIALGFTSLDNMHTKQSFQTLRDELEAVKRNLTERRCEVKSCNTVQQTSPQPPVVKENDPCPKCDCGWEQDGRQCYYFSTDYLTWNESRDECRQKGGDLVQIDSREEQAFLELKVREKMNDYEDKFWIGLTDSEKEGTWLWVDGSPLNERLKFWSPGQPDNSKGRDPDGQDCVRMGKIEGAPYLNCWFDQYCKVPHRRICEKPAETGHFKGV
ncbi:CD209 antigen-like protein E isoform X5 [Dicentrarchus labrax]|uniref:CD209 antigen-like protein E isoform X4 n=1 Tax=Dicentrarchus labrax TaxID=13489 RepID=UPI0021F69CF7|nr:CD209 antigen-like protein E isoform X4 [Dicentrarchus labrax]XP_051247508.1 CD209 antigen-like protein E isoform X5 [Dicentrarchus labrax]